VGDAEQQTGKRFPHDLQDLLTHIVLAHHGTHEFGSPRLPACPEAIVVHYLDNIDAKLHMFLSGIEGAKNAESDWTEYIKSLETRVFKKDVLSEPEAKS
jgi:3'-5' exoribonuclease